ncbi:LPS export ABC transporter ATP-binding protein, partial [Myxococcota bacterium]|nr:LPS export ABC transporter ATP-binding protein [Myxococcota bacterium]
RKRQVVKDVSLNVSKGEIVGLLGPNGAGKTTSFSIIAGLVPAESGRVILLGQDLGDMPLYKRARAGLGYLAQESTIFRGLTVAENFAVVYQSLGLSKKEVSKKVDVLLERYGLSHVRDNQGSQLSGGEKRRVEMARTLIPEPKVVLLDEPFAGVDPITISEIRHFIEAIREEGIGVLITDHNVRETLGTCDRAYLISEGEILVSGTPEVIVAHPEARSAYLGEDFEL